MAGFPPLRFKVGDRVEANCGEWMAGTIIKLYYHEQGWPAGEWKPYQIMLDDSAGLIYAPFDDDAVCRGLAPENPVFDLLDEGDLEGLQALLSGEAAEEASCEPNTKGEVPLCYALNEDREVELSFRLAAVDALLKAGASVNDQSGETRGSALHAAVALGDRAVLALLLAHPGVEVNLQDVDPAEFRNGAQWAKVKGDSRYLTEDEKDKASIPATALNDTPLLLALKVEDEEAAALLLDAGADVAMGDADGVTPLLQALEEGMYGIAARLVKGGANTRACSEEMVAGSPLHHYAGRGDLKALELLLGNCQPGDVSAPAGESQSMPLHLAARTGKVEACKLLLAKGADPAAVNGLGKTAAELAATNKKMAVVELLASA